MNYTNAQLDAITHEGSALLVSAAAGSGKTRVLVERLIRKIENGADIERYLIITYTRAAAAELRSKILETLSERLVASPVKQLIQRQIPQAYRAQISTIHAFCSRLLRDYAHIPDIRSDFRTIDEGEASVIKSAVLEDIIEEQYEKMDNSFRLLIDMMSAGRDDTTLTTIILDTYAKLQSHPNPELWLDDRIAEQIPCGDASGTTWGKLLLDSSQELTDYWIEQLIECIDELAYDAKVEKAYTPVLTEALSDLRRFRTNLSAGWDQVSASEGVTFPRLPSLRGYSDDPVLMRFKQKWKKCKEDINASLMLHNTVSSELFDDMRTLKPATDCLFSIVRIFARAYKTEKRRRSLMDYGDLEHETLRLLVNPDGTATELAHRVSQRYDEILVDEYQDVNRVQDMIFSAISRNGKNVVMVGDVKQSIYRFRLADPSIFLEKYESFEDNPEPGNPKRILLSQNFRSRSEILSAVNHVFCGIMSKRLGEMDYGDSEALKPGAAYPPSSTAPFELQILDLKDSDTADDRVVAEADFCASLIRDLIDSETLIKQGDFQRRITYGDIAVLLRSVSDRAEIFASALNKKGIPAATQKSVSILDSPDIVLLISLLRIIDNPRQDIPLIAVLRSPLYGFSADELAEIRSTSKNAAFFDALSLRAKDNQKCTDFLEQLYDFRLRAAEFTTDRLLRYIYDTTGLTGIANAETPGASTRLLMLLEYTREFEASGYKGLFSFIWQLDRLAKQDSSPLKLPLPNTGNIVTITSIHASKGLEYPVVILADLVKQFNRQDMRKPLLIHPNLGAGPKFLDTKRRIEYPTLPRLAIIKKLEDESLSEEMRVLYVAMTRAMEKLICIVTLRDAAASIDKYRSNSSYPIHPVPLADASSMADWLMYTAHFNKDWKLTVSVPEPPSDPLYLSDMPKPPPPSQELIDSIRQRLDYSYPRSSSADLPSKLTATELKSGYPRQEASENARTITPHHTFIFRRPDFIQREKTATPAERGTALHLAMQHINFECCSSIPEIRQDLLRLELIKLITPQQAALADANKIFAFFSSPLGKTILNAPRLYREFKFSLLIPASKLIPDANDDLILLQGVIDICLEYTDHLLLIDYKTDNVNKRSQAARAEFYRNQLYAYSLALEKIFNKPVTKCLIYFFETGDPINFGGIS